MVQASKTRHARQLEGGDLNRIAMRLCAFFLLVGIQPVLAQNRLPRPSDGPTLRASQSKQAIPPGAFLFNFSDAPWDVVIRRFAETTNLALRMESVPSGNFTYRDTRYYSSTEAIDVLNGELLRRNYILLRAGSVLRVISLKEGIPPHLVPKVELAQIDHMGQYELCSVVLPVQRLDGKQVTEDLKALLSPFGTAACLSYTNNIMVTDVVSNVRRIRDFLFQGDAPSPYPLSMIYKLKNVPAEQLATSLKEFVASQAPASGEAATTAGVPDRITIVAEPSTNSVLITAPEMQLRTLGCMIRDLDNAPQVIIQAMLVEVELDHTHEVGVELGAQDSVLFDRSLLSDIVTLTESVSDPVSGIVTTNDRVISQSGVPGFAFNNSPLGNNVAVRPSHIGTQSLSNFGVGRINNELGYGGLVLSAGSESINVLLRALSAHRQVDILSRPQIRTLENHQAEIQIGAQVPVVDGVSITAVGSANPVIRQDQAGIILRVRPRVKDDSSVVMEVSAERSSFQPGAGVPIFTDATSGNVIQAPIKNLTQAQATVSISNGETVVLGGMITNDLVIVERKVPWLGDIPVIGWAFRHDLEKTARKELLIFLTPKIIRTQSDSIAITNEEIDRTHFPHDRAQEVHGPFFPAGSGMPGPQAGVCEPNEVPVQQSARAASPAVAPIGTFRR